MIGERVRELCYIRLRAVAAETRRRRKKKILIYIIYLFYLLQWQQRGGEEDSYLFILFILFTAVRKWKGRLKVERRGEGDR